MIDIGGIHMLKRIDEFAKRFKEICDMGWIESHRTGNDGGVGNTLEDLFNIVENNLQLPDYFEWELKSQRKTTSSLLTLFHLEPEPREAKIVSSILLPKYGWKHKLSGAKYSPNEMSFRATLNYTNYSDRGFKVNIDYNLKQIYITFDSSKISERHLSWKNEVNERVGLSELNPRPFWSFGVIANKLETKLKNLLYIQVDRQKIEGKEFFRYTNFEVYTNPTLDRFLNLVEKGYIYFDFDARTGHNHGTKIRIKPHLKNELYENHIHV